MARAQATRPVQPALSKPEQPIFYYDLGNPSCYLVAEQIMAALPQPPEWEPVLGTLVCAGAPEPHPDRELIERRAAELALQPLRWPGSWPVDSQLAMLVATYCKRVGRAVAFSLAAFRQEFAGGRDLADRDTVLIAAAACELHPTAVLGAMKRRSVGGSLQQASARARLAGVRSLPAIQIGSRVFEGDAAIDGASRALEEER